MKNTFTLLLITLLATSFAQAQTTYTVSTDKGWNGNYPAYCNTCTFNISTGKTLTIDKSNVTCYNCTFNGGKIVVAQNFISQGGTFNNDSISMNNKNLQIQSSTTTFNNAYFAISGAGYISGNAAIVMTNSTFVFTGTSYFNPTWPLDMKNSNIYLWGDASMSVTGTPINLKNNSHIVVGDGSLTSKAFLHINGPTLNEYDASSIKIANKNNYYRNWSAYNYYGSTTAPTHLTYNTTNNNLNCGGSNPNACSAANVYGPSTLTSLGLINSVSLAVTLTDFSIQMISKYQSTLSWTTVKEVKFDRFVIERSADGNVWQSIGTVAAALNNTGTASYNLTDAAMLSGANYYRLKMVDKDGSLSYSKILSIKTGSTDKVSLFPNPITGSVFTVRIPSTETAIVNVFTTQGQLLYSTTLKGQLQYAVTIPSGSLRTTLIVQVISNGESSTFNVINQL